MKEYRRLPYGGPTVVTWESVSNASIIIETGHYGPRNKYLHEDDPKTVFVEVSEDREWFVVPPGHLAAFNSGAELAPMIDYLIETYGDEYPWLNELV